MADHERSSEIFTSRRGAVTWCPECEVLHLEFGNMLMSFRSLMGLETFQSRLRTLFLQTGEGETGLVAVQSGPTAGFTFAKGEMREIDYLIDGAAAMARRHEELREELG